MTPLSILFGILAGILFGFGLHYHLLARRELPRPVTQALPPETDDLLVEFHQAGIWLPGERLSPPSSPEPVHRSMGDVLGERGLEYHPAKNLGFGTALQAMAQQQQRQAQQSELGPGLGALGSILGGGFGSAPGPLPIFFAPTKKLTEQ